MCSHFLALVAVPRQQLACLVYHGVQLACPGVPWGTWDIDPVAVPLK